MGCDFSRFAPGGGAFGYLDQSIYLDCRFDGADLTQIAPGRARFERCQFTNVRIRDWFTSYASFVDCVFAGRIERSTFAGRWGIGLPQEQGHAPNEFHGNDFSRANMVDTSFRYGIDLLLQILPGPPQYVLLDQWPARVARARELVRSQFPGSEREKALRHLEILSDQGSLEQSTSLLRRDEVHSDVLDVLETAVPSALQ
jgi:hypothetical protein